MPQFLKDQDTSSFADDQTLSPLVEGFTTFRINQLQTAESTIGDLAERITSPRHHHVRQTHLNHLIGHTYGSRT